MGSANSSSKLTKAASIYSLIFIGFAPHPGVERFHRNDTGLVHRAVGLSCRLKVAQLTEIGSVGAVVPLSEATFKLIRQLSLLETMEPAFKSDLPKEFLLARYGPYRPKYKSSVVRSKISPSVLPGRSRASLLNALLRGKPSFPHSRAQMGWPTQLKACARQRIRFRPSNDRSS